MTKRLSVVFFFPCVGFYLKVFHTRFLMRQYECNVICQYNLLFSPKLFFPLDFLLEFSMRHVHIVIIVEEEVF
jgi:hypothetical protein